MALASTPLRRCLRANSLALFLVVTVLANGGCEIPEEPPGPRPLSAEELALLDVDGRVSKWLPSRFSATIENPHPDLALTRLRFEVHGKVIERAARIGPGERRRISVQYLFPEDDAFGNVDPETVVWKLLGAVGEVVTSSP